MLVSHAAGIGWSHPAPPARRMSVFLLITLFDSFIKLLSLFFFFLIEMLAVTFDFTVALTSMGALGNILGGFTHLRLVGITVDFSSLAIQLFHEYNIVFFDNLSLPSLRHLFGWITDFSGWLSKIGIKLENIFLEVRSLRDSRPPSDRSGARSQSGCHASERALSLAL